MTQQATAETIATIGIDLGKNTFHLIGMDARGKIVLRRKIARGQLQSDDHPGRRSGDRGGSGRIGPTG